MLVRVPAALPYLELALACVVVVILVLLLALIEQVHHPALPAAARPALTLTHAARRGGVPADDQVHLQGQQQQPGVLRCVL